MAPPAPGGESARKLEALFILSAQFMSLVNIAELLEKMTDCLIDIFQADRGVVLLTNPKTGKPYPVIARGSEAADPGSMSYTVIQRVAQTRTPALVTDVGEEHDLMLARSIVKGEIRSIVCAPLVHAGRLVGVIYLDSQVQRRRYGAEDLALIEAFSQHAAQLIENVAEKDQLRRDVMVLKAIQKNQASDSGDFAALVGKSAAIKDLVKQARAVARQDVTALILGESGTGKELLARALHSASRRQDRPFVAVNCMALASEMIESELFGHEKGAFTGAAERNLGRFELASGGTIFLDEIGELSPRIQVKLLRVLQERQIERVGSSKPVDVDLRLLAATHVDLEAAMKAGRFREDLYYRINVVALRMPALRERPEDIPLLADHFVRTLSRPMGRNIARIAPDALEALVNYRWPGNIRELRNVIERALVLEASDVITAESLPFNVAKGPRAAVAPAPDAPRGPMTYEVARQEFERRLLTETIARHKGNISAAALELGLARKSVYRKLEALDLDVSKLDEAPNIAEAHQILESFKRHGGNISAVAAELGIPRTTVWRRLGAQGVRVDPED